MLRPLFFAVALLTGRSLAAPYIATNYIQLSVYTEDGFTNSRTTEAPSVYTYTEKVVPATPVSAITTITVSTQYPEVTILDVVVASASPKEYTDDYPYSNSLETQYVVPITYTPSPTCTGQNWTYTTNVPIYIPDIVSLSPVTVSTSVITYTYLYLNPSPSTEVFAILNPTDVSAEDLTSASLLNIPYDLGYCYTPTTYCGVPATATVSAQQCTTTFTADYSNRYNGGYVSGEDSFDDGYRDWLRNIILIAVLVPVGWWLIWLGIGLFESWLSFKGLMLGQHRKRGLPYAWCCISIFFLCWTGPTYKAKSAEEQARLLELWNGMTAGQKFKLWMQWGFRWKYPVDILGDEPELAKRAPRQGCL